MSEHAMLSYLGAASEIERLRAEIERLLGGICRIQEFLEETPPRIGDATWTCEALRAGTAYEQKGDKNA